MSDTTFVNGTTLSDGAGWAQDVNDYIYRQAPKWCGTATGTANALTLTTVATNLAISAYAAGQRFEFKAGASSNSGATTVAVDGLTTKAVQARGTALAGGEIEAGKWYRIVYDGAAFQLEPIGGPFAIPAQTFLQADVNLNNTANYFNVCNTGSIGAAGQTWTIRAVACVTDGGGSANFLVRIWDGSSTVYVETEDTIAAAGHFRAVPVEATITLTGATTFHLSCKDPTSTGGVAKTTAGAGTANKATWIVAERKQ